MVAKDWRNVWTNCDHRNQEKINTQSYPKIALGDVINNNMGDIKYNGRTVQRKGACEYNHQRKIDPLVIDHSMEGGPVDLVLVRHGESEGDLAQCRSKHGVEDDWCSSFGNRHSSQYRLTDNGRSQAKIAGEYIKNNIYKSFDRCFTSEYARAMETASLLDINNAHWDVEFCLRERDNGILDGVSKNQRKTQQYAKELARRERDLFYWQPPGGESIAGMCIRVAEFLKELERSCAGLKVIVVCHGNIMEGFRLLIEKFTQATWSCLRDSTDPYDKIHNCQVLWYTRREPKTHRIRGNIKFCKSICPWDLSLSRNKWELFVPPTFTNDDLLARVQSIPQLVERKTESEDNTAEGTAESFHIV